jgi:hypothetical protein
VGKWRIKVERDMGCWYSERQLLGEGDGDVGYERTMVDTGRVVSGPSGSRACKYGRTGTLSLSV